MLELRLTLYSYLEAKRYYERKRRAETITEEEEITWLSIEKAEKSRNKVRIATMKAEFAAQQEEMDEDTLDINDLFYPDEPLTPAATSETKKRSRQESGHHVNESDGEEYVSLGQRLIVLSLINSSPAGSLQRRRQSQPRRKEQLIAQQSVPLRIRQSQRAKLQLSKSKSSPRSKSSRCAMLACSPIWRV